MEPAGKPLAKCRRDGWTPERRRQFLECLAAGWNVSAACGRVALSREAAYRLRRRDSAFAQEWDAALLAARQAQEEGWLAMLPERLRRTMSELSGECELAGAGLPSPNPVDVVRAV